MIAIEKRGRRIEIRSDEPLPGFRTAIPGAYETVGGYWTVPLSLETCQLLRQKYGKRLKVGNELSRWARGVRDNREQMKELAKSEDAELFRLPDVAPKLAAAMENRLYQKVGARFVADNSATLIADEPGLGKTLIALGGILESDTPGPYLIVAPKTASRAVWAREIKRWLPKEHRAVTMPQGRYLRERTIKHTPLTDKTWFIVHPEIVLAQWWLTCQQCNERSPYVKRAKRQMKCGHVKTSKTKKHFEAAFPKLFETLWGTIVVDECHDSLICRTSTPTQRRIGLETLKIRPDGLRIALSGTPMDSKPHQLWGTLNWLAPHVYTSLHNWTGLYWRKGGYTGFEIGEFMKEREPMLWSSLDALALRRTKAEVAQDLPPKLEIGSPLVPDDETSPIGIWLEMDGPQAKAYQQMRRESGATLKSGRLEAITAIAELTRLKQLACSHGDIQTVKKRDADGRLYYDDRFIPQFPSNKFQWCIEALEEWGYPKNPLTKVVFVSFYTSVLELFAQGFEKHFKTKPDDPLTCAITGRITSARHREAIIKQFNYPAGPKLMMLNVKAGGTAITLDRADKMVFLSETRIPDQQLQAEDRIHRVSNPRQCMYYYLRSLGTVDVGTAILNQQAIRGTHAILDGRRGVEYLREVLRLSEV